MPDQYKILKKIGQGAFDAFLWPFRILRRITKDGLLFAGLAILCAFVATHSTQAANIPLLICLVLFSALLTSLILGWWSLRKLSFERRCPERTFAGEGVTVSLVVSNASPLPSAGVVINENLRAVTIRSKKDVDGGASSGVAPLTGRALMGMGGQTFAVAVPGKGHERVRYSLMVRRRGIYQFGRTHFSTVFPFGFWRSYSHRRKSDRLVVYPRLNTVDTALFQELEVALQRIRRTRPSLEEQDFRGLREYRFGDNPKWIHWGSSARLGKFLVKEYEEPQAKRVLIFLDSNLQRLGTQRFPAFELAVSFTASVARELVKRGCDVTTYAQSLGRKPVAIKVSRDRRNLDELFEFLAGIQPDNSRTLGSLQSVVTRQQLRNVFVLILGLGSFRVEADLSWVSSGGNIVKRMDVRGEEFRRIFRKEGGKKHGISDEELLLSMGDDDLEELAREDLALVG